MNNTTTIKYGLSNEFSKDFGDLTVGDLINDAATLGVLGAPEGVSAISGGRTLSEDDLVSSYSVITLEKRASEKA